MKIYVICTSGTWWPDRDDPKTMASFNRISGAATTREKANAMLSDTPLEPEWFVGTFNGVGHVLVSGVQEVEVTEA